MRTVDLLLVSLLRALLLAVCRRSPSGAAGAAAVGWRAAGGPSCGMTFMRPSYLPVELPPRPWPRSKYRLLRYIENRPDAEHSVHPIGSRPALFLHGSGGSYKQVRSLASETAKQTPPSMGTGLAWYAADYAEELSALDGSLLEHQTAFAVECIETVLQARRGSLPLILVGHSMGGLVARLATHRVVESLGPGRILLIVTLASPHAAPPLPFSLSVARFYKNLWQIESPVPVVSLAGGPRDLLVPPDLATGRLSTGPALSRDTRLVAGVWTSMDHQAIVWCNQLVEGLAATLLRIHSLAVPSQGDIMAALSGDRLFRGLLEPSRSATGPCAVHNASPIGVYHTDVGPAFFHATAASIKAGGEGTRLTWAVPSGQEAVVLVAGVEPCVQIRMWLEGSEPSADRRMEITGRSTLVPWKAQQRIPRSPAEHEGWSMSSALALRVATALEGPHAVQKLVLWLSPAAVGTTGSGLELMGQVSDTDRAPLHLSMAPATVAPGGGLLHRLSVQSISPLLRRLIPMRFHADKSASNGLGVHCWEPSLVGRALSVPVGPGGVALSLLHPEQLEEAGLLLDPRCDFKAYVSFDLVDPVVAALRLRVVLVPVLVTLQATTAALWPSRGVTKSTASPALTLSATVLGPAVWQAAHEGQQRPETWLPTLISLTLLWLLGIVATAALQAIPRLTGRCLLAPWQRQGHHRSTQGSINRPLEQRRSRAAALGVAATVFCSAGCSVLFHPSTGHLVLAAGSAAAGAAATTGWVQHSPREVAAPLADLFAASAAGVAASVPSFVAWAAVPSHSRHPAPLLEGLMAAACALHGALLLAAAAGGAHSSAALRVLACSRETEGHLGSLPNLALLAALGAAWASGHGHWSVVVCGAWLCVRLQNFDGTEGSGLQPEVQKAD